MSQPQHDYHLSSLQYFLAKVAIVTAAVLIVVHVTTSITTSWVKSTTEKLSFVKGGPAFWGSLEEKLYVLADAPDLPPERKQKIVDALHRLAVKYQPYVDALRDSPPSPIKVPPAVQR